MSFNFKDAKVETGSSFMEPGIYVVDITEVNYGLSEQKKSPYIEFKVADNTGATASHRYFINQTVGEGKEKSAWDISKNQIFQIVAAAVGDEEKVRATLDAKNGEELAKKIAINTVGKKVRLKLNGKEIPGSEGRDNWVKTEFGTGLFAESTTVTTENSRLKFSKEKNIKRLTSTTSTSNEATTVTTVTPLDFD